MTRLAPIVFVAVLAAIAPVWARSPGQTALDEGVAHYKKGEFQDALVSFRRAVDLDPSLTKAWENLGWAQHRLGDDREALRIWNTLLKLEPGNVASWNAVGEVHLGHEDWSDAAAAFERSLAVDPRQNDVRLRLGQADERLGRKDAAAAQYRAILARRPGDAKATIRLADLEESRGQLGAAETVLRAAADRSRPDRLVEQRLARIRAKQGDDAFDAERWDEATAAYREAADRDPSRSVYRVNLGWAQRKSGDTAGAIASWRRALAGPVTNPSDLWRAVGDAERDSGRIVEARQAYTRAAEADPGSRSAYFALAILSLDGGRTREGIEALRRMLIAPEATEEDAIRAADLLIRSQAIDDGERLFEDLAADPARASSAKVALARLHAAEGGASYRVGDDAGAAAAYRKALAADPRNRAALRDYGWTLWREADWAGVRRVWDTYAASYPELAEPQELLGRLELQHGDPQKAIERAQEALTIGGKARGPEILLTKAYLADGKFQRARRLGEELAAQYPDDLSVQTLYAETLWRSLDFAASKAQWRKVIDMGADSPRAMHYWLRSLYETGDADAAVAAAEGAVAVGRATEPVLRLLAEDALVRGDAAGTVRRYRELTERYPQRVAYWTALAEAYRAAEDYRSESATLEVALMTFPDSQELRLLAAENALARGHAGRALHAYEALEDSLGRNRSIFDGELRALRAAGRDDEALVLARDEGPTYQDADELALTEASILEDLGLRTEAAAVRQRVIVPKAGSVRLPVLLYHGIADHPRTLNTPLDRFEAEMQAIHDAGYTTITVTDLDVMLAGRKAFPRKPIAVTFDDARGDSMRFADPVLQRLGMKATMFVPTVRIADESAFNADWATLRRLAATGRWDFQAHGHLAHDPIPIDEEGGMAEFLVNRQWLVEEGRLETHDEFVARVEGDYEICLNRMTENLPGQAVVAYAFPFSEMGQLHGGNDPQALAVNERAFGSRYRYGFVQDSIGYNTLAPGSKGPLLLRRLGVRREWDASRLLAHLESEAPAARAKLAGAEADVANAAYRKAETELRGLTGSATEPNAGAQLALAYDLHEQGRERDAERQLLQLPSGPAWGRPAPPQRKLTRDVAWEVDPQAGAEFTLVSDSDHRDSVEALATGRYSLEAPVDLAASAGGVQFRDAAFPTLSGFQGRIDATWVGARHVAAGGWLRGRALGSGVSTLEGQATFRAAVDGHRVAAGCGVTDVQTVGALLDGIQGRGCEAAYDTFGRTWHVRARLAYRDLTDGNAVAYGWGDGTVSLRRLRYLSVGGRLDVGDSRNTSPLYYAPTGLVTLLGIARYARSFPGGATVEVDAGIGPSRDDQSSARVVGQAHVRWSEDWGTSWRSTVAAEYGETPDYRRTAVTFSFGYRF